MNDAIKQSITWASRSPVLSNAVWSPRLAFCNLYAETGQAQDNRASFLPLKPILAQAILFHSVSLKSTELRCPQTLPTAGDLKPKVEEPGLVLDSRICPRFSCAAFTPSTARGREHGGRLGNLLAILTFLCTQEANRKIRSKPQPPDHSCRCSLQPGV